MATPLEQAATEFAARGMVFRIPLPPEAAAPGKPFVSIGCVQSTSDALTEFAGSRMLDVLVQIFPNKWVLLWSGNEQYLQAGAAALQPHIDAARAGAPATPLKPGSGAADERVIPTLGIPAVRAVGAAVEQAIRKVLAGELPAAEPTATATPAPEPEPATAATPTEPPAPAAEAAVTEIGGEQTAQALFEAAGGLVQKIPAPPSDVLKRTDISVACARDGDVSLWDRMSDLGHDVAALIHPTARWVAVSSGDDDLLKLAREALEPLMDGSRATEKPPTGFESGGFRQTLPVTVTPTTLTVVTAIRKAIARGSVTAQLAAQPAVSPPTASSPATPPVVPKPPPAAPPPLPKPAVVATATAVAPAPAPVLASCAPTFRYVQTGAATKLRCSCGEVFGSEADWNKHRAETTHIVCPGCNGCVSEARSKAHPKEDHKFCGNCGAGVLPKNWGRHRETRCGRHPPPPAA